MINRYQKIIALGVIMAFLTLLPISSMPLPAAQALSQDEEIMGKAEQASNFIEKEQQVGYQATQKNILPIILGVVALSVGVFLLVMLVSKVKYDVTGVWEFHNDYTTEGSVDYDSVWTFTSYDYYDRVTGIFERNASGKITRGQFFLVNKKDVMFQDNGFTEAYIGSFDSKETMSGTFQIASAGAKGNWTAKKK